MVLIGLRAGLCIFTLFTALALAGCGGGGGAGESGNAAGGGGGGQDPSPPSPGGAGSIQGQAVYSGLSSHEGIQVTLLSGTVETSGTVVAQATTSATGSYSFTDLAEGTYFLLATSPAADAPVTSSNQQLAEGEEVTVESLQLVPTGSISGTILRSDGGTPLGADVFLAGRSFDSASDASGNFLMGKVEVGTYDLFVQLAGFDLAGPVSVAVTLGNTTALAPITLSQSLGQGNLLFGNARLSDSTNHGGISIAITGNGINELTQTDTLGNYAFFNLPAGTGYVIAATNPPDYLPADLTGISVIERESNRTGTIILQAKPGTVDGVVTLAGETSHIGYTLEVLDTGPTFTQNDAGANGAFSIASVPAGSRTLRISKPGFETVLMGVVVPANGLVNLPPRELTNLVGVLSATFTLQNAASHENIVVSLQSESTSDFYLGSTDTSGLVQLMGVRAGSYGLTAKKIGSNFTDLVLSGVPIAVGATTSLPNATFPDTQLPLVDGSIAGTVNLNVSDFTGDTLKFVPSPCDGCQVTAAGQAVLTNSDGSFLLIGVPEGEHTVTVTSEQIITDQFDPFISPPVTISPTQPAFAFAEPINLYQATGTIVGVALLEGASEHFNIQVTVEGLAGYSVVTDALGNYAILSVPVGNYSVTATLGPDFISATKTDVTVRVGETTFLSSMQVVPLPGALTGTFLKDGFTDHSGIVISVGGQSGITDVNGLVSIPDVPAGVQVLTATADGFKTFSTVVTIPPNNLLSFADTTLEPQRGQIAGIIELVGQSDNTGAVITLNGTPLFTTSAFDGTYSLLVPIGNYTGVTITMPRFQTVTFNQTITVTETGVANIPKQNLLQIENSLSGSATLFGQGDHSAIRVRMEGLVSTPTFGHNQETAASSIGVWNISGLPLGEFTLTAFHVSDATFETVTRGVSMVPGDPQFETAIELRQLFVKINDDAVFTTSANVTLTLGAVSAAEMRIGDVLGGGVFEPFAATKAWTLPSQGSNTVFVTFRDASLAELGSASDSILLDSLAVISSLTEDSGGATLSRNAVIHLRMDTGETGGTASVDIVGFENGIVLNDFGVLGDIAPGDGVYERNFTITSSADISGATVTGRFTDAFGSVATPVNAPGTITVGTPPLITLVQVLPSTNAESAIIKWVTDEAADTVVNFGLTPSLGTVSSVAEAVSNHQVTLTGLTRGETYHFTVSSTDASANAATSSPRTFMVAPAIALGVAAYPGDAEVAVVWSANTEQNLVGYNLYRSTTSGSGFSRVNPSPLTKTVFVDTGLTNGDTYFYKVSAEDSFGIEGALSAEASATPESTLANQSISGIIDVNTVLSAAGNPWQVTGDILINKGVSLFVLPGVEMEFQGPFKIRVEGELQIIGVFDDKVLISAAVGQQWKGIEWIAGAAGAVINAEGLYQSGSALRHVDIEDAGVNGFTWLRLEAGLGAFLEGVTIGNCVAPCLVAEDLGGANRVVIDGGSWSTGAITLTGGGLVLRNATLDAITLTQTGATLAGIMAANTIGTSTLSLSKAMTMSGNDFTGGSLSWSHERRGLETTSDGDSFTNVTADFDRLTLSDGAFSGGTVTLGSFSALDAFTMTGVTFSAIGNVTLSNGTFQDTPITLQFGVVENSTFLGSSPLDISGDPSISFSRGTGQVIGNAMNGNPITITGIGAVEENTLNGASITVGAGLVRANTITGAGIEVTGAVLRDAFSTDISVGTEILDNTVSAAPAEGISVNNPVVVLANNQVSGSDVGLRLTHPELTHFQAYGNSITGNRIGILWEAGCAADCDLDGSRFDLSGNTELAFSGNFIGGGLVNLTLRDSWWGSTALADIRAAVFDRFDGSSSVDNTVAVFYAPWISGPPLAGADFDGDGLADIVDGDDDNDGYCDLQEARESRLDLNPPDGFSPVNAAEHPVTTKDCDGDGIADVDDTDDDDDGLVDTLELASLGSNPFAADTDGDGISDLDEFNRSYDPLDNSHFPITAHRGYLAPSNVPFAGQLFFEQDWVVDGWVSIPAGATLTFDFEAELILTGVLFARGTVDLPILFTSAQTTPARGDWNGIKIDNGAGSRIEHVTVEYSGDGGMQLVTSMAYIISKSLLQQNISLRSFSAGGLTLAGSPDGLISETSFIDNQTICTCSGSGGIFINTSQFGTVGSSNNLVSKSIFLNNSVITSSGSLSGSAGAIVGNPSASGLVIDRSEFTANFITETFGSTQAAGAISIFTNVRDVLITGSIFRNNSSDLATGAIHFGPRNSIIENSVFTGNTGRVGALVLGASNALINSLFEDNIGLTVGAVTIGSGGSIIDNSIFRRNSTTLTSSSNPRALSGAVASSTSGAGESGILNSQFENNFSSLGAGAISSDTGMPIVGSVFIGNSGGVAGAIVFRRVFSIRDRVIDLGSNSAVSRSVFTGNSSSADGSGGAIYLERATNTSDDIQIASSTFSNNTAGGVGSAGAIKLVDSGEFTKLNRINVVDHATIGVSADTFFPTNAITDSYFAGNNGAASGVVDFSQGSTSTSTPPQWENFRLTSPRSTPHPDAPPIP